MMTPIRTRRLSKHFGSTIAVDGVDLDVDAGDLFFLLGPSGCGKTTLLRMLAGFTEPTDGNMYFGKRDVTHLPANQRNAGMVFQGYALWPHMSVFQNVAFGLDVRRIPTEEKKRRVTAALRTVQMEDLMARKPNQLSGGQQQRVALARALVIEPTVLLLDEPLSNLDAKLRLDMRSQIRQICKQVGITAIYVTHDQKEALSMADRMAVLREGRLMQTGAPRELYARPNSRFVADFLGETNFISAIVKGRAGKLVVLETVAGTLHAGVYPDDLPATGNVTCSIRPEALSILNGDAASTDSNINRIAARRAMTIYLGEMAQYQMTVGEPDSDHQMRLKVFELNPRHVETNETHLHLTVAPEDVVILRD